jgi:hypothetical protein
MTDECDSIINELKIELKNNPIVEPKIRELLKNNKDCIQTRLCADTELSPYSAILARLSDVGNKSNHISLLECNNSRRYHSRGSVSSTSRSPTNLDQEVSPENSNNNFVKEVVDNGLLPEKKDLDVAMDIKEDNNAIIVDDEYIKTKDVKKQLTATNVLKFYAKLKNNIEKTKSDSTTEANKFANYAFKDILSRAKDKNEQTKIKEIFCNKLIYLRSNPVSGVKITEVEELSKVLKLKCNFKVKNTVGGKPKRSHKTRRISRKPSKTRKSRT